MLEQARMFAITHHGDQKYDDKPYAYHLDSVESLLEPYGKTAQTIGYLHDVVEDTPITPQQIEEAFGTFVSQSVIILTDQAGNNRKERKQKTYPAMSKVAGDLELALVVKTADRLANVKACVENNRLDKLSMYQEEHNVFKNAVYRKALCDELWNQLDDLLNHFS